jgi:pimeloyl-ACP methyl ester carboxylesterase
MKTREAIFAFAAALGGVAGAVIATRVTQAYRRDQRIALAQWRAMSDVIETARGLIEYAELGSGPAVLVIHGGGGGFDQGLHCVRFLGQAGVRFIAPSRFGYLRTPLPPNPTPEAQADAHAALLDALGLDKVCAMGVSAGGMSAAQFALRHPDRCWGLVLVSAVTRPVTLARPGDQWAADILFSNDFAMWALTTYTPQLMLAPMGLTAEHMALVAAEPAARAGMFGVVEMPQITRRRDGVLNDLIQAEVLPLYPLERITAPTLVIHGTADPQVPFHIGAYTTRHIPGAKMMMLEGGGHLAWFTHAARTRPAALEFFAKHAPH